MEEHKVPVRRTGSSSVYPALAPPYVQMPPYKYYHRSWLVPLFIVANIVMFVITMIVNNCPKHSNDCKLGFLKRASFQPLSENPLLGPSGETLQKMGALSYVLVVKRHQWWRLFTCIWLHAGVFHLLANMLSLLFIGIRLEQEFGFIRIGILYILSGFGGSILSAMFVEDRISVGASGALFGLLGGMLSELITNWSIYSNKLAALFTLIIIIAINLAVGILPHVDNFAHIGGFISGFLLGFVLLLRPQLGYVRRDEAFVLPGPAPSRSKYKKYQLILLVLALILLIAGFIASLVVLFKGVDVNRKCSWCHYLSCVPTSRWHCNRTGKQILCHYDYSKGYLTVTCDGTSRSRDWPTVLNDNGDDSYCTQSCS